MSTPARRRLMRDFKRWDNLQNILLDDVNPWEKENYVLHEFQCEEKRKKIRENFSSCDDMKRKVSSVKEKYYCWFREISIIFHMQKI